MPPKAALPSLLARRPRPGDKARELREALAARIQALIDEYNASRSASPSLSSSSSFSSSPPSHLEDELISPALLSLDMGTAMSMGTPPQHVAVYHTLLSAAALAGRLPLVLRVLGARCGCTPDESSRSGVSPLLAACFAGHVDVIEALLDFCREGGDPYNHGGGGGSGHGGGIRAGGEQLALELVNVCVPSGACGRTAVEACVQGGRASAAAVLPLLLRRGLRVNGLDAAGRAPLDIALSYRNWQAASLLCQVCARPCAARFESRAIEAALEAGAGGAEEDVRALAELVHFAKALEAEGRGGALEAEGRGGAGGEPGRSVAGREPGGAGRGGGSSASSSAARFAGLRR